MNYENVAVLKMKLTLVDNISSLERLLTQELQTLEARIKELEDEASALRRQIAKASARRQGLGLVSRKNSLNRVLVETSVLDALRKAQRPLRTKDLYKKALETNPQLKENTFRTYLHRMKLKDVIFTARKAGEWRLPEER